MMQLNGIGPLGRHSRMNNSADQWQWKDPKLRGRSTLQLDSRQGWAISTFHQNWKCTAGAVVRPWRQGIRPLAHSSSSQLLEFPTSQTLANNLVNLQLLAECRTQMLAATCSSASLARTSPRAWFGAVHQSYYLRYLSSQHPRSVSLLSSPTYKSLSPAPTSPWASGWNKGLVLWKRRCNPKLPDTVRVRISYIFADPFIECGGLSILRHSWDSGFVKPFFQLYTNNWVPFNWAFHHHKTSLPSNSSPQEWARRPKMVREDLRTSLEDWPNSWEELAWYWGGTSRRGSPFQTPPYLRPWATRPCQHSRARLRQRGKQISYPGLGLGFRTPSNLFPALLSQLQQLGRPRPIQRRLYQSLRASPKLSRKTGPSTLPATQEAPWRPKRTTLSKKRRLVLSSPSMD